jgi:hypothetical protein
MISLSGEETYVLTRSRSAAVMTFFLTWTEPVILKEDTLRRSHERATCAALKSPTRLGIVVNGMTNRAIGFFMQVSER